MWGTHYDTTDYTVCLVLYVILFCLCLVLAVKSRVKAAHTDARQYLAPNGVVVDLPFDWWSKFYASLQDPQLKQEDYDRLQLDKLVVSLIAIVVCHLRLHPLYGMLQGIYIWSLTGL